MGVHQVISKQKQKEAEIQAFHTQIEERCWEITETIPVGEMMTDETREKLRAQLQEEFPSAKELSVNVGAAVPLFVEYYRVNEAGVRTHRKSFWLYPQDFQQAS